MKQQPVLSACVKCDRKIGEAAVGGGGALLGSAGRLWQGGFSHLHLRNPPSCPRAAMIPTQHLPKRAQGAMEESQMQFSVIPRTECRWRRWRVNHQGAIRAGSSEEAAGANVRKLPVGSGGVSCGGGKTVPSGEFIRARH